ncbi:hypothetical protein NZD89_24960 [Alicyclobacillus fastidiosus]|uniref:Uncharacterized protein n=1 Tax=Alicyclobacillus fastidiosus TaxID=392011 RepID=A0ABY6ZH79_9BACL|nr:hypothetical protein [Alicyclobacillus fastidiosus]WAH41456.1 hypothetical protein NZD89_24960 [Alicyclobacillus fastidiosus]GMA63091.1 hypothetical protein GCM10025859_35310 [Alicyclobacillus fastidiosus]
MRWCDSDHVIFTYTLDQKPSYGLASISEPANDAKSVHVEVTVPLVHDQKLTCIMGWDEHKTRLLGVVNGQSIVQIRVKLGWVTLYQQPVDSRFYLIDMPYAFKDMIDYQYMYVQGVDNNGRVVADTKQTNLKYDNLFLRSRAILHGLLARAHH